MITMLGLLGILSLDASALRPPSQSSVLSMPDIDGDGISDFAFSDPRGSVYVVGSVKKEALFTISRAVAETRGMKFERYLGLVDDVDGDQREELAIAGESRVEIFSSSKGTALFEVARPTEPYFATCIELMSDLNGDGVREFAVSSPCRDEHALGVIRVFSGIDGALVHELAEQRPDSVPVTWHGASMAWDPESKALAVGCPRNFELMILRAELQDPRKGPAALRGELKRLHAQEGYVELVSFGGPPEDLGLRQRRSSSQLGCEQKSSTLALNLAFVKDQDGDGCHELLIGSLNGPLSLVSTRDWEVIVGHRISRRTDGYCHTVKAFTLGDDLLVALGGNDKFVECPNAALRPGVARLVSPRIKAKSWEVRKSYASPSKERLCPVGFDIDLVWDERGERNVSGIVAAIPRERSVLILDLDLEKLWEWSAP